MHTSKVLFDRSEESFRNQNIIVMSSFMHLIGTFDGIYPKQMQCTLHPVCHLNPPPSHLSSAQCPCWWLARWIWFEPGCHTIRLTICPYNYKYINAHWLWQHVNPNNLMLVWKISCISVQIHAWMLVLLVLSMWIPTTYESIRWDCMNRCLSWHLLSNQT